MIHSTLLCEPCAQIESYTFLVSIQFHFVDHLLRPKGMFFSINGLDLYM
jgi:hypothetical protein